MSPLWIVLTLLPLIGAGERFSCRGRILGGYYADVKSGCRAFHVCVRVAGGGIRDFRFFCPPGTLFQQEAQTCTDWGDDDGLACPADLYDGRFDLYKIGTGELRLLTAGFDTKKVSEAPRDDNEFSLQRAETGDRRLSNQQSQQSDLRASHSSDFFSGRRDNGRDDVPETPSPTTPQPSPSTRAPYRRPPPRASPRPTAFAPEPSTPDSSIAYEPQHKRKLIRKRPISSTAPPTEYTTASRQYFRSTKSDYVTASPANETPVGSYNEDSGSVDVVKVSPKVGRYDAPNEKKFSAKIGLTEVYNYNAQSTPNYNNFNNNYNQNNNNNQNNEFRNQNNGENLNIPTSNFNNNLKKQNTNYYKEQNNNQYNNNYDNQNNNFNNQVKTTTQNTNFNQNNNYNQFNNQNSNYNNQIKPTTQNNNFNNQNNNFNNHVNPTTQSTNYDQSNNYNNQNFNNQNNFNAQYSNNQNSQYSNNDNLNNENHVKAPTPENPRPYKATVRNHYNVAPVPEFTVDSDVRKNVEVSPNGVQRQTNGNYAKSTNIGSSTPSYKNFNSVSYDAEKKFNKHNFASPSTTPNYEKTRNTSPLNLNTIAYKTNVGFDAHPVNYAESEEDDGQYKLPSGEDDGQYRPELYERDRELLSGAHSLNIAASKNQLQEDQKPRRPQPSSQTAAPRPFSVASTVAPTDFQYPTTQRSQRPQPTYQTYPTTSRPQPTQTISVETSSPAQSTFEYTNSVYTTRRPVTPAYVSTTRAPPLTSSAPPQPFRPEQQQSRPASAPKAHKKPTPNFAKPPSSAKEDSSYDYAYYDTDSGFHEYDQIEEFGKTKSKA